MKAASPKTYYVYTYAFPDGRVFYVGKGCNARIDDHEREARHAVLVKNAVLFARFGIMGTLCRNVLSTKHL